MIVTGKTNDHFFRRASSVAASVTPGLPAFPAALASPLGTGANLPTQHKHKRKHLFRLASPFAVDAGSEETNEGNRTWTGNAKRSEKSETPFVAAVNGVSRQPTSRVTSQRSRRPTRASSSATCFPLRESGQREGAGDEEETDEEDHGDVMLLGGSAAGSTKEWSDAKKVVGLHRDQPKMLLFLGSPLNHGRARFTSPYSQLEGVQVEGAAGREYRREDKLLEFGVQDENKKMHAGIESEQAVVDDLFTQDRKRGQRLGRDEKPTSSRAVGDLIHKREGALVEPLPTERREALLVARYTAKLRRARMNRARIEDYQAATQEKEACQGRALHRASFQRPTDKLSLQGKRGGLASPQGKTYGIGNTRVPGLHSEEHDLKTCNQEQLLEGPAMDAKRHKLAARLQRAHDSALVEQQRIDGYLEAREEAMLDRIEADKDKEAAASAKQQNRLKVLRDRDANRRQVISEAAPPRKQQVKVSDYARREHAGAGMACSMPGCQENSRATDQHQAEELAALVSPFGPGHCKINQHHMLDVGARGSVESGRGTRLGLDKGAGVTSHGVHVEPLSAVQAAGSKAESGVRLATKSKQDRLLSHLTSQKSHGQSFGNQRRQSITATRHNDQDAARAHADFDRMDDDLSGLLAGA